MRWQLPAVLAVALLAACSGSATAAQHHAGPTTAPTVPVHAAVLCTGARLTGSQPVPVVVGLSAEEAQRRVSCAGFGHVVFVAREAQGRGFREVVEQTPPGGWVEDTATVEVVLAINTYGALTRSGR